jgi:alpha-N-arabinofuranosidase
MSPLVKSLLAVVALVSPAALAAESATMTLRVDQAQGTISPEIYGQFAEHLGHCVYGGIWVGENSTIPNTRGIRNDVVAALKAAKVPVIRWPGGCFADEYHWKDGIGPREKRLRMINTHWGGVVEDNSFGTHEFFDLCDQVGAQPYVCGNVGSGTVQEMMEWIEYMTSDADSPMANLRRDNGRKDPWKLKYLGVGNESWGCGGTMRPEFYADNFRRYNTFVKNYAGNRVYRIACGPNVDDYKWTDTLMNIAGRQMNGLSLHYYTLPTGQWDKKGSATEFDRAAWDGTVARTLRMEELLAKHSEIMDKYDPKKRVGLIVDEWGAWYDVEPGTNPGFLYQQNTMRDAVVAAINLNLFNRHSDRVKMANVAQMVNVLQSMILTDKEKMVLTPTYWVFEMYAVHQGATPVPIELKAADVTSGEWTFPSLHASASRDSAGRAHLSIANLDSEHEQRVSATIAGLEAKSASGRLLTAAAINSHNTFDHPDAVKPADFTTAKVSGNAVDFTIPAKSVLVLELR